MSISVPVVESIIVEALFGKNIWSNKDKLILFFGIINLERNLLNSVWIELFTLQSTIFPILLLYIVVSNFSAFCLP